MRRGSKKRPHRVEVTFTDKEWIIFQSIAKKAGEIKLATFARKLVLSGSVIEKLTPGDRKDIAKLNALGRNLHSLLRIVQTNGWKKSTLAYSKITSDMEMIIKYFNMKLYDSKDSLI